MLDNVSYEPDVVPVFFLSDSTGISAETMGNALLIQFPDVRFERTLIPFISSLEEARDVVAGLDAVLDSSARTPLVFATAASDEVRLELLKTRCEVIDFFGLHMERVESILDAHGVHEAAQLHGVGDIKRYNSRMQAVEYTIEHDDGQSVRSLEKADVILVAPSRCGKTPTAMYLALQHGLFVANYPIVPEDLESNELPRPVKHLRERCFGLMTTPARLSAVRQERRPGLPLRLARPVHLRAASHRGDLQALRPAGRRLLDQVRGGDLDDHPAGPQDPTARGCAPRPPIQESAMNDTTVNVRPFSELGLNDLEEVGGKNSSLGEMVSNLADLGVNVPDGFATTAEAYRRFIGDTGLAEEISAKLKGLDTDDTRALAEVGREIREAVATRDFPDDLEADIRSAFERLVDGRDEVSFAVRSSATAEDLPDASFAGQQETFLNIKGIDGVLQAIREVFASLYNDRAIAYRVHHDFDHDAVALSAGVQQMVRSDIGASGVMFTMDTESGFDDAVFITSAYGLGEGVVQGAVNPDEFYVYKPALQAGRPAILKRGVGGKATKMIYTDDPAVGQHHGVRRHRRGRAAAAQPDRRRGRGAGPARADHRGALRPADGHRVGQGRPRRPALHPPGAARDGDVARRRACSSASGSTRRARSSSRAARSARRSAPARCG